MRVSFCLPVTLSVCISQHLYILTSPSFLCVLPVAVSRSYYSDITIRYVLPVDDVMFSLMGPMAQAMQVGFKLKVTYQVDFTSRRILKLTHQEALRRTGAESDIYDCLVCNFYRRLDSPVRDSGL